MNLVTMAGPFLALILNLTLFTLTLLAPSPAWTAETGVRVLFILDGSGSMRAKIQQQEKIDIAKEVMIGLVRELPPGVQAGLEVYGHRRKGDCEDIELMVPVGKGDKADLIKRIHSIEPKGHTPITKSLQMAAETMATTEEETTLVLVSDGKETCQGDPCALMKSLKDKGIKLKTHVIGFDVTDEEKQQLACIATAGGGKYFTAKSADQLKLALGEVKREVVEKIEPRQKKVIKLGVSAIKIPNLKERTVEVYSQESGQWVGNIRPDAKKQLEVPPGTYKLKFNGHFLTDLRVQPGEPLELTLGTVTIPHLSGRTVEVYTQASGEWVGNIKPMKTNTAAIPGVAVSLPGGGRIDVAGGALGSLGDLGTETESAAPGLEVPAGTYKLKFNSHFQEGIEVAAGAPTVVQIGSISMPNLRDRSVEVYEQTSSNWVGNLRPDEGNHLELPAGTYKLKFGNHFLPDIRVEAGEDLVLEQ